MAAGCGSSDNTLVGKWVVDKEWLDQLPTPQTDEEAKAIYGQGLASVPSIKTMMQNLDYEFETDGPHSIAITTDGERQIVATYASWQVRGDWIILPDADSLEFHWLKGGKLQIIGDPSVSSGTATFVRAEGS